MFSSEIKEKLKKLTQKPGVYLMKDKTGHIIYVGKAKNLKNRVSQYFNRPSGHTVKVRRMVENIYNFDYIITDTEFEALVLECNLIKLYRPKYNILLKDDKQFPFIRIENKEEYPKMTLARKKKDDGALYFGPYPGAGAVKQTISQLCRIFMLPTCKKKFPRDLYKGRPCLNYHIKRCAGVCAGNMSKQEYQEKFDQAIQLLKEGPQRLISDLQREMEMASGKNEFERCAVLRDEIKNIRGMFEPQKVYGSKKDRDVISFYDGGIQAGFIILTIRGGKLLFKDVHLYQSEEIISVDQAYAEFLSRYYDNHDIPPMIVVGSEFEGAELLVRLFSEKKGKKVEIRQVKKGEDFKMLSLANENIKDAVMQKISDDSKNMILLQEIRTVLKLKKMPVNIEAYDISHTGQSDIVGGMVAFTNGLKDKKRYKTFKIKSIQVPDDYAAIKEIIYRRIEGYMAEKESFSPLPDVIFLDGGQGHVYTIAPMISELAPEIEVFGLVKDRRHRLRGVVSGEEEIPLCAFKESGPLLGQISDEVHRFALSFHHRARKKGTLSVLEEIEGIGPKRRARLLLELKSIKKIKTATIEELMMVKGMTKQAAQAVYDYFNGGED